MDSKNNILLMVVFILAMFFLGCAQKDMGKQNGKNVDNIKEVKEYDKSGNLILHMYLKNGLRHGVLEEYYSNGSISVRVKKYILGKIDGTFTSYYENGNINMVTNYVKGEKEGEVIIYYENGKHQSRYYCKDGQPNGVEVFYYPNGNIEHEGFNRQGLKDSIWIFYDSLGNIISKERYAYGRSVPIDK